MSVEHVSDELLQRHFDGELEPSEQAPAREHISACAACSARLRSLERMQHLLRMAAEDAAVQADFQGMFARIEAAAAGPVTMAAEQSARPAQLKPAAAKAQQRWFRGATMSAAGAVAVAAAVLLMVFQREPEVTQ